jgi:tRNA(fMet)-specific endonuclease VapC
MSLHILDTDILTLYQEGDPMVCSHALGQLPQHIATTVLSIEEQLSGWYAQIRQAKKRDDLIWAYSRLAKSMRFLARLVIVDFDAMAMQRYEQLRQRKLKIGKTDLRIAATVIENGATLVTRNLHDFQQVPGLTIEDWSK